MSCRLLELCVWDASAFKLTQRAIKTIKIIKASSFCGNFNWKSRSQTDIWCHHGLKLIWCCLPVSYLHVHKIGLSWGSVRALLIIPFEMQSRKKIGSFSGFETFQRFLRKKPIYPKKPNCWKFWEFLSNDTIWETFSKKVCLL